MSIKKIIIGCVTILLTLLCITIFVILSINKNKKYDKKEHSYSDVISTDNITDIECRVKFSHKTEDYVKDDYIFLTDNQKNTFIDSINNKNLKFKYEGHSPKKSKIKGFFDNTFIIHYGNGNKMYFDDFHIQKFDDNDKEFYHEYVLPYECVIGQSLFLESTENMDVRLINQFEMDVKSSKYSFKKEKLNSDDEIDELNYFFRYYKCINNYITDDYYDVRKKDGLYEYIKKSDYSLKEQKVYEINYKIPVYDKADKNIISYKEVMFYHLTNDSAIPLGAIFVEIGIGEDIIKEIVCTNLFNGENYDYNNFLGWSFEKNWD